MPSISLNTILDKKNIQDLIHGLSRDLDTNVNIFDSESNLLFGQFDPSLAERFVIKNNYRVIGWLKGKKQAKTIAEVIDYLVNQESEIKKLSDEVSEKYEEINLLHDISAKISRCSTVEEVIKIIVDEIKTLIDISHVSVMLLNSQTKELDVVTSDETVLKTKSLQRSEISKHVLESGKAEIINDVLTDPRYIQGTLKIRSLICAPLTIQNETIGVINISHSEPLKYRAEDLKLFIALTSQAAAAIKTVQYYEQLKEYSQTLENKVIERTIALEKAKQELEKANLELQQLATIDQLTQIANRRKFDEYLEQEWRRMLRARRPISLILCDVDYFKLYNDYYGHPAGDKCLQYVARALGSVVKRATDLVSRYGGEEFAVILPNTDEVGATRVVHLIQAAIADLKILHELSKVSNYVTLSLGIATAIPLEDEGRELLLKAADISLYSAKNNGRNRYKIQTLPGARDD